MPPPLPLPPQPLPDRPPPKRWPGYVMLAAVALVPGFLLAYAVRTADRMQTADRMSDAPNHVRTLLEAQETAWNAGDLDGFMAGYWNDERLTFASGGDVTRGWQPTLDRYRKRYQAEGKEMGTLAFSDLEIEAITADAVVARGRWTLTFTKSEDKPTGLFTLLVRKKPDGWKVVHDHTSAAEPPKKN